MVKNAKEITLGSGDLYINDWVVNESVGTGDGSTTQFSLDKAPVVEESEKVYVNGVAKTRGTDYTIDYQTGEITFSSAPASGDVITADYLPEQDNHVGYTKNETVLALSREINDFLSGLPQKVIKRAVIREEAVLRFTLAQVNAENLNAAFGGGVVESGTGKKKFRFGGDNAIAEKGLTFIHTRPDGKKIKVVLYKASPSGGVELPFNEDDWTTYGVEFKALAFENLSAGKQYGFVEIEE